MKVPSWLVVALPLVALGMGFVMGDSCGRSRSSRIATDCPPTSITTTTSANEVANTPQPASTSPPAPPPVESAPMSAETAAESQPAPAAPIQPPQAPAPTATVVVQVEPTPATASGGSSPATAPSASNSTSPQTAVPVAVPISARTAPNGNDGGASAADETAPAPTQDPSLTSGAYEFGASAFPTDGGR